MWIDSKSIPVDTARADEAHRFIDHMLRPKVIVDVSNTVFFASATRRPAPMSTHGPLRS